MLTRIWNRVTGKKRKSQGPTPRRTYLPRLEPLEARSLLATFTVSDFGDTSSTGTLRWAIEQANKTVATDTIKFAQKPVTIALNSPLPAITQPVIINGQVPTGDPFYAPCSMKPGVELDGSNAGVGANGIVLTGNASSSDILGLAINRFDANGVVLNGVNMVDISGNYVGTDLAGTSPLPNGGSGVSLNNAFKNTIGGTTCNKRNVISANEDHGVVLSGTSSFNNSVIGNRIGTDVTGMVAMGNQHDGVRTEFDAHNNTIGGLNARRNIISANGDDGVELGTNKNTVENNYIGVTADGMTKLGNTAAGIRILGNVNTIESNVVSANSLGILATGPAATANTILKNKVGTDFTGTYAIGNTSAGIDLYVGANSNLIQGNLSSGNDLGVYIASDLNIVIGNFLGTDVSGTNAIPNLADGVYIDGGNSNLIGGTSTSARNIISGNNRNGVVIRSGASDNKVQGNYIGVDKNQQALGNKDSGVFLPSGSPPGSNNVIGSPFIKSSGSYSSAQANYISHNGNYGVYVAGGTNTQIGANGQLPAPTGYWNNGIAPIYASVGPAPSAPTVVMASNQVTLTDTSGATAGGWFELYSTIGNQYIFRRRVWVTTTNSSGQLTWTGSVPGSWLSNGATIKATFTAFNGTANNGAVVANTSQFSA